MVYFSPATLAFFDLLEPEEQEQVNQTRLASQLEKLSDKERELIELRYGLNGNKPCSFREASSIMNVPHPTLYSMEKRVIKKLNEG